jgi:hypothetical protein
MTGRSLQAEVGEAALHEAVVREDEALAAVDFFPLVMRALGEVTPRLLDGLAVVVASQKAEVTAQLYDASRAGFEDWCGPQNIGDVIDRVSGVAEDIAQERGIEAQATYHVVYDALMDVTFALLDGYESVQDQRQHDQISEKAFAVAHPNHPRAIVARLFDDGDDDERSEPQHLPGSIAQRLADSKVDLLTVLDGQAPERDWLPCSDKMLARGKRYLVAAPMKSGKTMVFLVHAVDMVIAGATVVILDRENGADEYARRLRDTLDDRDDDARDAVRARLSYHQWPELKLDDGAALAVALAAADLVIFDSSRTFLALLGLAENSADDFAQFASATTEALFRAGIASVLLDNTGLDKTRARGTTSKGDLADVVLSVRTVSKFDRDTAGRVELRREHSRLGDQGAAFTMDLGAGRFGKFIAKDAAPDEAEPSSAPAFRPTTLMERVSRAVEAQPALSKNAIRMAVPGRAAYVDQAVDCLVAENYLRVEVVGQAKQHHSVRPFRAPEATDRVPSSQPCPDHVRDTFTAPCPRVPLL